MDPRRLALLGLLVALAPFLAALLQFELLWLIAGSVLLLFATYSAYRDERPSGTERPATGNVTCPHCRARESPDREACRFCGGVL